MQEKLLTRGKIDLKNYGVIAIVQRHLADDSLIDFREVIQDVLVSFGTAKLVICELVQGKPSSYINDVKEYCQKMIQEYNEKILPFEVGTFNANQEIYSYPGIEKLCKRSLHEYFLVKNGNSGKLTIRDASQYLEQYLQIIRDKCNHEDCSKPTTPQKVSEQKLSQQYVAVCDRSLRHARKIQFEYQDTSYNGKRFYQSIAILPNCAKEFVNYIVGDKFFTKKKDSEGYVCLKIIERLHQIGLIDDYLYLVQDRLIRTAKEFTLEFYPPLFRVENGYIQKPLKHQWDTGKLYVQVFSPYSQKYYYPFQSSIQQKIGFLSDRDMNHLNLDYLIYQDQRHKQIHLEQLVTSGQVATRQEGSGKIQPESFLKYTMNQQLVIDVPTDTQEAINFIQRLKFYHTWAFYMMMGLEHSFLRGLLKGKFTFGPVLFEKQIKHAWSFYGDFLSTFVKQLHISFDLESLKETHMFIIPILSNEAGENSINMKLIDSTIRHCQMQIIGIIERNQIEPRSLAREDSKQHLYSQTGGTNKGITRIEKIAYENWNRVAITTPLPGTVLKYSEIMRGDKLTLAQFYQFQVGLFPSRERSKNIVQFHKLQSFIDCSPNKSIIANDSRNLPDHEVFKLPYNEDTSNFQLVPGEMADIFPLRYDQYAVMQHACAHLLKLNDYMRAETFINEFFKDGKFEIKRTKDIPFLEYEAFSDSRIAPQEDTINIECLGDVRKILYGYLPLINEALTSPHTQLLKNYERLEIYGDSIISLLVIVEFYLSRESKFTEDDLDSLRKQRISNDQFIINNCLNQIYKYMMIEPQSQLPSSGVAKDTVKETSGTKNHTIMRSLTPGGLGGAHFQQKLKKIKQQNFKTRLFHFESAIYRAKNERCIHYGKGFQEFSTLLEDVLKKSYWRELLWQQYPGLKQLFKNVMANRDESFPSTIDQFACEAIKSEMINIGELKQFILGVQKEKLLKTAPPKSRHGEHPIDQSLGQMELRITKDKKMADVIESLGGAVMQTCGVHVAFQFLHSIGVLKQDFAFLRDRLILELKPLDEKTQRCVDQIFKNDKIGEVEEILKYKFTHKHLLLQALTHKSFSDHIFTKEGVRLPDYNLMEFLGDSILNYFVLDFFYRKSSPFKRDYSPSVLHRLKSEIVNNNFLSLIVIENQIHEKIEKIEKLSFTNKFAFYIDLIKKSTEKENEGQSTRQIFKDYFTNDPEEWKILEENFMDPKIMRKKADQTINVRQNMEDIQHYCLKVFGDVLEALVAAVFLDSGGSLKVTQRVVMGLIKPYLYVYGNTETTIEHPRTQIIDQWAKEAISNIKDHPIKISHLNSSEIESDKVKIIYRGFLGGVEVVFQKYELQEKNKVRMFFKQFQYFVKEFIDHMRRQYPQLDQKAKQVGTQTIVHLTSDEAQRKYREEVERQNAIQREGRSIIQRLNNDWLSFADVNSSKQCYEFVIQEIKKFRLEWNKNQQKNQSQ